MEITRRQLLGGLTLASAGCAGPSGGTDRGAPTTTPTQSTATSPEPVTVGGSLPLSGSLEPIGRPLYRGLRTWKEEVNANEGLRGRRVALEIADDEGDPETAHNAYRSLVERADLLVGPYGSRATAAVIDVIEAAGIPCLAHTAGNRGLWADGRDWTVQLLNPIDTFLHVVIDAMRGTDATTVALLYREDDFTATLMQGAVSRARSAGWDIAEEVMYTNPANVPEKMQRVTDSDPDLLLGSGFTPGAAGGGFLPDTLALSRAYEQVDGRARLVNWGIGAAYRAFREQRGAAAEHETGVTGWKPYVPYPNNRSFVRRYADRWDDPAETHAAQGYASGQVLASAVDRAASLEPHAVRDAVFDLEMATVFGRYSVNERGLQVGKRNVLVQWQSGEPAVVAPTRWQTGDLVVPK